MFAGTFFGISLRSFYFTGSFLWVSKEHNLLTGQLVLLMHWILDVYFDCSDSNIVIFACE